MREYFSKLLNEDYIVDIRTREDTSLAEHTSFHRILGVEVMKALKQMKTRKATDPYDILIEALKCMPDEWRSIVVPIYKNNGDIQNYIKYQLSWDQIYEPYYETMGECNGAKT